MAEIANQDAQILAQMDSLEADAKQYPMIGAIEKIGPTLLPEYKEAASPGFIPGIEYLDAKYPKGFRRVRRDGNCFYRAFLYSYLELVLKSFQQEDTMDKGKIELQRFRTVIVNSKDILVNLGFSEFAFECFYDELIELLDKLPTMSSAELYDSFQEGKGSPDEYTWFSRLLTSANMRIQSDRFLPFLDDTATLTGDMVSYLQREVEPMGKECEQVHIIALTDFLGVRCIIENLDGHKFDGSLSVFDTDESGDPAYTVALLYRPGHYDCLYK